MAEVVRFVVDAEEIGVKGSGSGNEDLWRFCCYKLVLRKTRG